jgi:type I restriction enzyme, S subunit
MNTKLNFHAFPFDMKPPVGWEISSLAGIIDSIQSGFASGRHNRDGEGIPHLRPMNINPGGEIDLTDLRYIDPKINSLRLGQGDILFNNTNSQQWVGKTALIMIGDELAFSNHMTRVKVKHVHINADFIAKQLNFLRMSGYFQMHCKKHVNQASIAGEVLKNDVPILVPPTNEQRRIVTRTEELQARSRRARAALETIPDLLDQLRQSVLAAAFRGDLTKEWREKHPHIEPAAELLKRIRAERRKRWEEAELGKLKVKGLSEEKLTEAFAARRKQYKEPKSIDTSALPKLPMGWTWCWLSDMGYMNRGKSKHRPRNAPHLYGGEYPFIQTGDIAQSQGQITTHRQSYSKAGLIQSQLWPEGTVCITIAANIASSAILSYPACFPDSVVGVITDDQLCKSEYVEFFIRTIKNTLDHFAPATAQKNINIEILKNVVMPLAPRLETDAIVKFIETSYSHIKDAELALGKYFKQLEFIDQSILSKAFRGELVLQDPNDEPASALLERIRQERTSAAVEPKAKAKQKGRKMHHRQMTAKLEDNA